MTPDVVLMTCQFSPSIAQPSIEIFR
jgi:hypothetical protein